MNQQIPLWQQYGFPSEKEFRDRYPESGGSQPKQKAKQPKTKTRKRRKR